MPAAKAIRALLTEAAAVTAIVPVERIYPARFPQGALPPGIVITRISSVQIPFLDAEAQQRVSRDRIQVAALSGQYPQLATLIAAIDRACTYQRGVRGGVVVHTITRANVGPDLFDDARSCYERQVDFLVTYDEP